MMKDDLTPERVDDLIEQWEEAIASGHTFLPVQNAPETLEALKRLRELMTSFSPDGVVTPDWPSRPCRACGERVPTMGGYCEEHR